MLFKRKKPEETPKQIAVKTKAGFSYVFDLIGKKLVIAFDKGFFEGKYRKKTRKQVMADAAGAMGGAIIGASIHIPAHELVHDLAAVLQGGSVSGTLLEPKFFLDSPLKEAVVAMSPQFFEAIVGLILLKEGIKRGNPVYFGYGIAVFPKPAMYAISDIFLKAGDFTAFARDIKLILIQTFADNRELVSSISKMDNAILILLAAATIYGTAIFGTRYVSKIRAEFVTATQTKRILRKLKQKDNELYNALGRAFLWKADKYRNIVLDKL